MKRISERTASKNFVQTAKRAVLSGFYVVKMPNDYWKKIVSDLIG